MGGCPENRVAGGRPAGSRLTAALTERPGLQLKLNGGFAPEEDRSAQQATSLNEQLVSITGDPDAATQLTGKTRKALEKLARTQLPDLSLAELQAQHEVFRQYLRGIRSAVPGTV